MTILKKLLSNSAEWMTASDMCCMNNKLQTADGQGGKMRFSEGPWYVSGKLILNLYQSNCNVT